MNRHVRTSVNAAAATVQAYFTVKPSIILNIGVCGALADDYKQGDIVVPIAFMQHDIDTTAVGDRPFLISGINEASVPADELGVKLAAAIHHAGMNPVMEELCATGDSFIEKGECRQELFNMTGAGICDMEAGAIAQVCRVYGIPFAAAKVISDGKGDSAKDYAEFMDEAPQIILALARAGIAAYGKRGDS